MVDLKDLAVWLEKLDSKIYLATGDRLTPHMKGWASNWWYSALNLSVEEALLRWLKINTIG